MSTKPKTAEQVLKAAKRRLNTHGWQQHNFGGAAGPNCALGALDQVTAGANGYTGSVSNEVFEVLYYVLGVDEPFSGAISDFNDAPETTRWDVEALFDAGAEVAHTLGV